MSSYYLDMLIGHFKGEGFVVVRIQRAFLDGGFLFPQPFSILHQGDLHVGICNCNPIRISFSRNSLENIPWPLLLWSRNRQEKRRYKSLYLKALRHPFSWDSLLQERQSSVSLNLARIAMKSRCHPAMK